MSEVPQKHLPEQKKRTRKASGKEFFTVPEKKTEQSVTADFRMRLGGIPLESKAGFELLSYRLRRLLRSEPDCWQEIDREENGSFWSLFRKYHLPLLTPFFFFFTLRELLHFTNLSLLLRHVFVFLPAFVCAYAGYMYLLGIIAEETAEFSGGRFSPQSGTRIAVFSSLIVSFMSVAVFLPVVGIPLLLLSLFWHYRQLFSGARTLLNISGSSYRLYRLSHIVVWVLLGLIAFLALSVISFIAAKLGIAAI